MAARQAGPALLPGGHAGRRADGLRLAHRDRRSGRGSRLPVHLQRRLVRHPAKGIDIFKIKMSDPSDATVVRRAASRARQCHDNTVFLNGANSYASCAGGNGISMFKFDMTIAPRTRQAASRTRRCCGRSPMTGVSDRPLRRVLLRRQDDRLRLGAGRRHVAAVPGDQHRGRPHAVLHERRGSRRRRPRQAATLGTLLHPRPQIEPRELHVAQLQHRADARARTILVSGNYQAGIIVVDFTNPTAPSVIAHADPNAAAEGHRPERQHVRSGRR